MPWREKKRRGRSDGEEPPIVRELGRGVRWGEEMEELFGGIAEKGGFGHRRQSSDRPEFDTALFMPRVELFVRWLIGADGSRIQWAVS
jgi:hypothetical protein